MIYKLVIIPNAGKNFNDISYSFVMTPAVVWFRKDLRTEDQTALYEAALVHEQLIPLYILPEKTSPPQTFSSRREWLLLENLRLLDESLRKLGGRLILRSGAPAKVLIQVAKEVGARAIYCNADQEPSSRATGKAVRTACEGEGISLHVFQDGMIHSPREVLKSDGSPFKVFTPYFKKWSILPTARLKPAPEVIRVPRKIISDDLPRVPSPDISLPPAGEAAALKALDLFCSSSLSQYEKARDFPFIDSTSRLSHHLSFGTISPGKVLQRVKDSKNPTGAKNKFIGELAWRDFYKMILWHFPHVEKGCFRPEFDRIEWKNDLKLFRAWCEGSTGYPIVDAAMRQLNETGWMHNRLRMIVASFLTKDLQVSWQWGESYFMKQLFDGDLASNNGGWQWSAGTGTDAQPYFRIFNPVSQAEKFDPEGRFIEKFLPEVRTFLAPVVNHAVQRGLTLEMYARAKKKKD